MEICRNGVQNNVVPGMLNDGFSGSKRSVVNKVTVLYANGEQNIVVRGVFKEGPGGFNRGIADVVGTDRQMRVGDFIAHKCMPPKNGTGTVRRLQHSEGRNGEKNGGEAVVITTLRRQRSVTAATGNWTAMEVLTLEEQRCCVMFLTDSDRHGKGKQIG